MKFRWLPAAALGLSCGIVWAADNQTPAPKFRPIAASEPAIEAAAQATDENAPQKAGGPRVTAFAPLAYFNQNCARCHGKYGSFYGDNFAKNRDDDNLRAIVAEMASGPAQAPLAPAEVEILTAWHRALRDGKPFVALVKTEKTEADGQPGWQLSGEISPGATLQINGETVQIQGSDWTHQIKGADLPETLDLRAQMGETVTELDARVAAIAP